MVDVLVIRETERGFSILRIHDDVGKHPDGGMLPHRELLRITLNTPELQARTLDEWREMITDMVARLRIERSRR